MQRPVVRRGRTGFAVLSIVASAVLFKAVHEFYEDYYLSYPKVGEPINYTLSCGSCNAKWELKLRLTLNLEAISESCEVTFDNIADWVSKAEELKAAGYVLMTADDRWPSFLGFYNFTIYRDHNSYNAYYIPLSEAVKHHEVYPWLKDALSRQMWFDERDAELSEFPKRLKEAANLDFRDKILTGSYGDRIGPILDEARSKGYVVTLENEATFKVLKP